MFDFLLQLLLVTVVSEYQTRYKDNLSRRYKMPSSSSPLEAAEALLSRQLEYQDLLRRLDKVKCCCNKKQKTKTMSK